MYIYVCIYLRIFNNRQQKSVLLIVHNSQRYSKNYIGTLLTYWNFNSCRLLPFSTKQTCSTHFPITFKYFLVSLCYAKCQNILVNVLVHLLDLSFLLRCPVVRVGILAICITKFNSQGPALRILGLRVAIFKSQGLIFRLPCPRVPVPGSRVPGSQSLGSQGPGSQGPRSRVSDPDFRLCLFKMHKWKHVFVFFHGNLIVLFCFSF